MGGAPAGGRKACTHMWRKWRADPLLAWPDDDDGGSHSFFFVVDSGCNALFCTAYHVALYCMSCASVVVGVVCLCTGCHVPPVVCVLCLCRGGCHVPLYWVPCASVLGAMCLWWCVSCASVVVGVTCLCTGCWVPCAFLFHGGVSTTKGHALCFAALFVA